jgi:hypothetical protein
MRINQEYLKQLLEAFLDSKHPSINIDDLKELGLFDEQDLFVFHMQILDDKNLIVQMDGDCGFGLQMDMAGGYHWAVLPLRLTAAGHEFADALNNKEVWNTIKSSFKDVSIDTLVSVSKQLAEGYFKKKVENILMQ